MMLRSYSVKREPGGPNSTGGGGGAPSGGGGSSPSSAGAASAASSSTGGAARPAAAKVATPAGEGATKPANPFVALAKKHGMAPKAPPAGVQNGNAQFKLDRDAATAIEFPHALTPEQRKPQLGKPKGDEQYGEEVIDELEQEAAASRDDGQNSDTTVAEQQTDDPQVQPGDAEAAAGTEDSEEKDKKGADKNKARVQPIDLNQLEPEDRPFAKKMHPSATQHFYQKVKGLREEITKRDQQLQQIEQGGLPLSYYNHPEGYHLHPEYKTASENVGYAEKEATFWRDQLVAVENNQPFYVFEGVDANGRDIIKGPFNPTPGVKVDLQRAMYDASNALSTQRVKLEQLRAGFKAEYEKSAGLIDAEIAKQFPMLSDKEFLGFKIKLKNQATGQFYETTVADTLKDFPKHVPASYRDHPMTKSAASLFAVVKILQHQLAIAAAKEAQTNKEQTIAQVAEPATNGAEVSTAGREPNRVVNISGRKVVDRKMVFQPNAI